MTSILTTAERERLDRHIDKIVDQAWSNWEDRNRHIPMARRQMIRAKVEQRLRLRVELALMNGVDLPPDLQPTLERGRR